MRLLDCAGRIIDVMQANDEAVAGKFVARRRNITVIAGIAAEWATPKAKPADSNGLSSQTSCWIAVHAIDANNVSIGTVAKVVKLSATA